MYLVPYLCPVGGWWGTTLTATCTGIRGGNKIVSRHDFDRWIIIITRIAGQGITLMTEVYMYMYMYTS